MGSYNQEKRMAGLWWKDRDWMGQSLGGTEVLEMEWQRRS